MFAHSKQHKFQEGNNFHPGQSSGYEVVYTCILTYLKLIKLTRVFPNFFKKNVNAF